MQAYIKYHINLFRALLCAMLPALALAQTAAPGFSDSTAITSRIVAPSYCPNVNWQWLRDGQDALTHPNVRESLGVGLEKASDGNCYPIVNCQAGQTKTFTAGSGYSCVWASCPTAQPADETRALSCPAGQTGSITQARTYSCSPPNWYAGGWSTTSSTCASAAAYTCADGSVVSDASQCPATPPPPSNLPPQDPPLPAPSNLPPQAPPSVSCQFAPSTVAPGSPYSISWYSTQATSLVLQCSGAAPGAYSLATASGSSSGIATAAMQGTTVCTLAASNGAGSQTAECSLTVRQSQPADYCPNVPGTQPGPGTWPSLWGETYTTDGAYARVGDVCGTVEWVDGPRPDEPELPWLDRWLCLAGGMTFLPYGVSVTGFQVSPGALDASGDWFLYSITLLLSDGSSLARAAGCALGFGG